MKKYTPLLIFLTMISIPIKAEEVLFCVEEKRFGWSMEGESAFLAPERFMISVDFSMGFIDSQELLFNSKLEYLQTCLNDPLSPSMQCSNRYGRLFSINRTSLKFRTSSLPVEFDSSQTTHEVGYISWGTCEKF